MDRGARKRRVSELRAGEGSGGLFSGADCAAACDMPPQRDTTAKRSSCRGHMAAPAAHAKAATTAFASSVQTPAGDRCAALWGPPSPPLCGAALRSCAPAVALSVPVAAGRDTPLLFTRNSLSLLFAFRSALVLGTYMTNRSLSSY